MKKAVVLTVVICSLLCCLPFYVFADGYNYEEAYYNIPDYYVEYWIDADNCKWMTDDDNAEFSIVVTDNYDDTPLTFMSLPEVADYYINNLCSYPEGFTYESAEDYHIEYDIYGVKINGSIVNGAEEYPCEIFVFSTNDYIYAFEFFIYGETEYDCISDVMSSLYVERYSSYSDDYDEGSDVDFEDVLEFVIPALAVVVGLFCKYVFKKVISSGSENNTSNNSVEKPFEEALKELPKIKLTDTKFELNCKNITALNERFTLGKKDENFAQSELEKERRERENMFK